MKALIYSTVLCFLTLSMSTGFVVTNNLSSSSALAMSTEEEQPEQQQPDEKLRDDFEFSFEIPKKGIAEYGTAEVKLPPVLENSELVVVRYELPFGLTAEPKDGQVVVTKDGENGEKVGDILRQTTYWRGTQPGLFDVSKNADNFDLVVQALMTNDMSIADDIVLVFERPL